MARRILARDQFITSVSYALPNKHYIPVNMQHAGIDNITPYVLIYDLVSISAVPFPTTSVFICERSLLVLPPLFHLCCGANLAFCSPKPACTARVRTFFVCPSIVRIHSWFFLGGGCPSYLVAYLNWYPSEFLSACSLGTALCFDIVWCGPVNGTATSASSLIIFTLFLLLIFTLLLLQQPSSRESVSRWLLSSDTMPVSRRGGWT
jgi:hypothetical protein